MLSKEELVNLLLTDIETFNKETWPIFGKDQSRTVSPVLASGAVGSR